MNCHPAPLLLFIIALLSACAVSPSLPVVEKPDSDTPTAAKPELPKPKTSKYVITRAGGFTIEGVSQIKYAMTYLLFKNFGENKSAKVEFENPRKGSAPLVAETKIPAGQKKLFISSPTLPCIQNNRNYQVTLRLYSNGKEVAVHNDQVQFAVSNRVLNTLKVKLCK